MREGCSPDAVLGGTTSSSKDVEELSYRCSSGSGRDMGSSTRCNSAEDVGQQGQASTQVPVPDDQGDA